MAPVPYPYQLQLMPYSSPHLLRNMWRRLYPLGDDPVYRVYREHLADSVYEYHTVVTLRTSSDSVSYTRTSRSGYASTASQAVQFAAFEVLVELCYTEVQMQHHPGFYYYPSLQTITAVSVSISLIRSLIVLLAIWLDISLLAI